MIFNMLTVTQRCKKTSIRFNSQQSSIVSLFKHFGLKYENRLLCNVFLAQNQLRSQRFSTENQRKLSVYKNFITQDIRRKSTHFTLGTHVNHYPFQKEYDDSTFIKRIKGQTRGLETLIMKVLWSPIYYKVEGNNFKGKIWVLQKIKTKTNVKLEYVRKENV